MYTEAQWNNVLAFLNDEAEKPEPDGIGKRIDEQHEFVEMLRRTEAIKTAIVRSNAGRDREFRDLEAAKVINAQSGRDIQDQIDNHPGNPGNPGRP